MYGKGSGVTRGTTGAVGTVAGIAALPNTGGNVALIALSVATLVLGGIVLSSFIFTRAAMRFYR